MRTVIVDIIDDQAIKVLQELELSQLIRLHTSPGLVTQHNNPILKLKGTMTRQTETEIEEQLNGLREGWA